MWGFCALLWDQEVQVKTERLAEKPWDFAGLWFIGVVVVIYIYIYIKKTVSSTKDQLCQDDQNRCNWV